MRIARRKVHRVVIERLESRCLLAAEPFISEFQARNRSTLPDEDGAYSDWIEIGNQGDETADLDGWYLTDDVDNLTKWRFGATVVKTGEYLLVFASGKDRSDVEGQLHTNFRLSGNGEYLALVKPDGRTVAQDFGPRFPEMASDRSFGLVHNREATVAVGVDAPLRAFVPTDATLGQRWTGPLFEDAGWIQGSGAVGFENPGAESILREDFITAAGSSWMADLPEGSTATIEQVDGQLRLAVPSGQNTNLADRGFAPMVIHDSPDDASEWNWVAHIVKDSANDRGAVGVAILDGTTGRPKLMLEQTTRQLFAVTNGVAEYENLIRRQDGSFFLRWARNEVARTWTASVRIQESDEWIQLISLTEGDTTPQIRAPKLALYARTGTTSFAGAIESVEINIPPQRPQYTEAIGLNIASAMADTNSSVYLRIPFTLDDNPARFDSLELGVEYDDGFVAYLNGTEIASRNAPERRTWDAAADAQHGAANGGPVTAERIGLVDAVDLLHAGDNLLAIHGMNVAADDRDFFLRALVTASTRSTATGQFLSAPSPGAANLQPVAPKPRFIAGGDQVFFGTTTVRLATDPTRDSLAIHYTLDGTIPTQSSPQYTEPITVGATTVFQARTFDTLPLPVFAPSDVLSGTLVAVDNALRTRESELPLMIIDTMGQAIPDGDSTDLQLVSVALFDVGTSTGRASVSNDNLDHIGRGGVRDRGTSTAGQPKPNLTFETWGTGGTTRDDDTDVSLLGLSPESDWVLHAPFQIDRALMRNPLAFELSNQMGHWAPQTRFVEVYLNRDSETVSEDDYAGVYVLIEKIKQGEGRVEIASITAKDQLPPDITGGYIWKIDRADPDAPAFSAGGSSLHWVYPKSPISLTAGDDQRATIGQQQWVQDHFEKFAASLEHPDINDPEGYTRYIDVDSWIDQHILNTMMRNIDAFQLSTFLHQDRNGKIVYGPPWDFDRSAESNDERDDDPETSFSSFGWFARLDDDPGFRQRYTDRWSLWRQSVFSDENLAAILDGFADDIRAAADRNLARWPDTAPRTASKYLSGELDGTFDGEVRHLLAWLKDRAAFMDRQFTGTPDVMVDGRIVDPSSATPVFVGQTTEILSAPIDSFTDTTIVDDTAGVTQARYFLPTNNDLTTTWTDNVFDDSDWPRGPVGLGFDDRGNFDALLRTLVDPRENEDATSVLARIDFPFEDLSVLQDQTLFLRMKFDDGFVAYLNGEEVARSNLPVGEISWNTQADNHDNRRAVEFEDFDLGRFHQHLLQGNNVLAIHLVNSSARSNDMLLVPQLVARRFSQSRNPDATVYYTVDGTDPRGPDGNPATTALLVMMNTPVTLPQGARVTARSYDETPRSGSSFDTQWSAPVHYHFVVELAGDANRDGVFDLRDLDVAFRPGEYDDQIVGNSTWEEGDWNGDGDFNSSDLVLAFQLGQFVRG